MKVRVRLAPSPTGTLHIGTARTAVFNWLFARHQGGEFLVRIEDTDKERSKPEFTTNILEGLKWLGLNWDEQPIIQSQHVDDHRAAIQKLLDLDLAYRCYASETELEAMRETQKAQGQAPRYDNRHRDLNPEQEAAFQSEGRSAVVRFRIDDDAAISWKDLVRGPMHWRGSDLGGDMVISRRAPAKEIGDPLYNLVVVVDDAAMSISHVIRGEDHIANTAKQLLIYEALGLPIPQFAHTPLILNSEGRKLSKRDGVTSISDFQAMGYTAEAMANYMTLLGWSVPEGTDERFTLQQAATVFSFDRVNKAGAKFDWDKLNWLNSQVLHDLPKDQLLHELKPFWSDAGWALPEENWCLDLAELLGPSLTLLKDGVDQARPFFEEPTLQTDGLEQLAVEGAKAGLSNLLDQLDSTSWDGFDVKQAQQLLTNAAQAANVKKGVIMKSLRAALLGRLQGPDLITTWGLLARIGQDLNRLRRCL
ncbi:glutamate--tRNA ligase [Prochlorococcus sp. MIT 1303]|uniref:glutamate--tRNA ligase n=1 Tax=Prochlorococcus sp. MIT 1303 TaxID=1723647 RepID=UPI0007B3E424|nr:glutamate--tRNA ligase [Prochlorococcus sp. MIT 1303]KZR63398.1 Glutamate--tRNA ligase [Prochlorococcus sp. MIT 1303]